MEEVHRRQPALIEHQGQDVRTQPDGPDREAVVLDDVPVDFKVLLAEVETRTGPRSQTAPGPAALKSLRGGTARTGRALDLSPTRRFKTAGQTADTERGQSL
jgi:hypothetical protein